MASRYVGAVIALVGFASSATAGNGDSLLPLVPGDTQLMITVDVDALKTTPIWDPMMALVASQPEVREKLDLLSSELGVEVADLFRTVTLTSSQSTDDVGINAITLVEVTIDDARAYALLDESESYQRIGSSQVPMWRGLQYSLVHLGERTYALGANDRVRYWLDNPTDDPAPLAASHAQNRYGQVWMSASSSGRDDIMQLSFALAVSDSVVARILFVTATEEYAGAMVTGLLARRAEFAATPQIVALGLGETVESMEVASSGVTATATASISLPQLTGVIHSLLGSN